MLLALKKFSGISSHKAKTFFSPQNMQKIKNKKRSSGQVRLAEPQSSVEGCSHQGDEAHWV